MPDRPPSRSDSSPHEESSAARRRVDALASYRILDTPTEPEFDDVVRLVANIFNAPIAVINLIAEDRQWFKAETGIGVRELPLDVSICAHALLETDMLIVPDTRLDNRFVCNPLVTAEEGLRFYAGALLKTPEGTPIGTICVLDRTPRPHGVTDQERLTLEVMARQVMTQLELKRAVAHQTQQASELAHESEQRSAAHAALRASEDRYRLLFNSLDAGFCVIEVVFDDDGHASDYRFIEVNAAFENQTGLQDAAGKWMRQLAPDHEQHWFDIYGKVATSGEPLRFEPAAEALNERWYDVHAFRIGPASACQVAILFNDISARRNAEQRLRELNDTLESQVAERTAERDRIWRTSPDLMLVLGYDGVFRSVNPAWTAILGYTEQELVGTRIDRLIHPDDMELTEQALVNASGGPISPVENRYRHKDGSYRWVSWITAPPENGVIFATGRHVTAEKEQAEALARTEEQLRQAQKMEAVGQLTGGIAHDFNNLLTGITGSLEMMQVRMAQGRAGDVDRYVTAAQGAARRAAALTHRLLAFSRRQTLAPKPTDVKALVNGMEELISRSVGPDVEVEVVHAAGLWPSLIDPSQLENAVLNLCINARDAMPDGGRITIETGNRWMDRRAAEERGLEPGQYISLCVSDTGTGMTPEIAAKVFEPFFTTKPIGTGTGLGLSMIYGFAKQSGGTVCVYSEVGQGTMVCIYLPRHLGEAEAELEDTKLDALRPAGDGGTVLVVDDEPTVRMLVAEVLNDLGYTAIEASDGAAGLKIVGSNVRIDLLVTDVGLPGGMNGRQVADAARAARPGLKVLFITGYAENAVLSHGHLDPGMHVLTKPFAMEALASRIRELIADAKS